MHRYFSPSVCDHSLHLPTQVKVLRTLCSVQNPLLIEFADVYEDANDVHLVLGLCKGE